MTRWYRILSFAYFSLGLPFLYSQLIMKVIPDYVLIDTDLGIGERDERIRVYRAVGDSIVTVGLVRIIEFREGKTAARILVKEGDYSISVGDFVKYHIATANVDASFFNRQWYHERVYGSNYDEVRALQPPASEDPSADVREEETSVDGDTVDTHREPHHPLGLYVGFFYPGVILENSVEYGIGLGVSAALVRIHIHRFLLEATYALQVLKPILRERMKSSLVLFHLIDHIQVADRIHFDFGGGVYYTKTTITESGNSMEESGFRAGFSMGLSMDVAGIRGLHYCPSVRYHMYRHEGEWIEFVLGGITVTYALF